MPSLADALRDPIALRPNRPSRFYRGGRLLGAFRGEADPHDDDRPEDWVASATRTWTPPGKAESELGPSPLVVGDEELTLLELVRREPDAVLGGGHRAQLGDSLGVLVKLLDAGERLPVHCHPTRSDAARLLGSRFGKTEAWIILGTRDAQGTVWAGFREPTELDALRAWIANQDADAMLGALVELSVVAGDVILVPAGTPHAIGAGVFLLELQEPTDFSVVAETRGFPISDADASLRLGWDVAIGFFDTGARPAPRQSPAQTDDGVQRLFGVDADPFFRALRLTVDGERDLPFAPTFAAGIVLGGQGEVVGGRSSLPLARGETFALAATAVEGAHLAGDGLELILCLPPEPAALDAQPLPEIA